MSNDIINMSRGRDKDKIWLPNRSWTCDLPYIGRMLYPLSYEGLVTSRAIYKVHVCIVFLLKSLSMFLKESFQFCFNSTESLPDDQCAKVVYVKCGGEFREKLQNTTDGFRPRELCSVYLNEGNCNTRVAQEKNCTESEVLKRFKDNSFKAARVVLPALCSLPDKAKRGH